MSTTGAIALRLRRPTDAIALWLRRPTGVIALWRLRRPTGAIALWLRRPKMQKDKVKHTPTSKGLEMLKKAFGNLVKRYKELQTHAQLVPVASLLYRSI